MITYPMKPTSGGKTSNIMRLSGEWVSEPKYNGWRVLINSTTKECWNRHGEKLSIHKDFTTALASLPDGFWFDCEGLERRHSLGKGTLIVLDVVSKDLYMNRRKQLESMFTVLPVDIKPENDKVYYNPLMSDWKHLQMLNKLWNCEFYEGIVKKKIDSPYQIQLRGADIRTPHWIKYRFVN